MNRLPLMLGFVTVARLGGLSGAARPLSSSGSPGWSHIAAESERRTGVRLVHRTSRPKRAYALLDSGFAVALHTWDLPDSRVRMRRIASLPFALRAFEEYAPRRLSASARGFTAAFTVIGMVAAGVNQTLREGPGGGCPTTRPWPATTACRWR